MTDAPNCCRDGWRLIFAGSRFTTDAESRYAPIEGEALAIAYALEKCKMFTLGCNDLTVATDHKPLIKILGDCSLDNIKNPRLFSRKEKTLRYKYMIKHVPGAWHQAPDACSRQPKEKAAKLSTLSTDAEYDDSLAINACTESIISATLSGSRPYQHNELRAITLERVKDAARNDPESIALTQLLENGFPDDASTLPDCIRPYWKVRHGLSNHDGITLYEGRIVIPASLRAEVLDGLHSAHQGVVGMKARASCSIYWPGLGSAITNRRAQCKVCNTIAPSQPAEPMTPSPAPSYPFEMTVADYFNLKGIIYLVYADRYTGLVTIAKCPTHKNDGNHLKMELRTLFSIYGAPSEMASDGGQPFASYNVQQFLNDWDVKWRKSSAYYPQSNGRAELAVKTAKRILQENTAPNGDLQTERVTRALLQYRNTPIQGLNVSPAQLLFGRTLRDHLPSLPSSLDIRSEWQMLSEDRERALAKRHLQSIVRYNEHTKPLPQLSIGETVSVQNQTGSHPNRWDKTGMITEIGDHNNYWVRLHGSGRCTMRNRRFLRQIIPFCADVNQSHSLPVPNVTLPVSNNAANPASKSTPTSPQYKAAVVPPPTPPSLPPLLDNELHTTAEPVTSPSQPAVQAPDPDPAPQTSQELINPPLRRSGRIRRPPHKLSMNFRGKSHDYNSYCRD